MQCAVLQTFSLKWRVGGFSNFAVLSMSHGKSDIIVSDRPPCIAWASYSTSALLESIQQITATLKDREERASSSWEVASANSAPETQQTEEDSQGLKKPWTCGYSCKFCSQACLRREGHKNHSCYEHRHRR